MKMHEDNQDLGDKWKSQVAAKEGQIGIMNDQLVSLQGDNDKQRGKLKQFASQCAELEATLMTTQAAKKQIQINLDSAEEDRDQSKSSYQKLLTQYN